MLVNRGKNEEKILINLLPQDLSREKRRKGMALAAGILIVCGLATGVWYKNMGGLIAEEQAKKERLQKELRIYTSSREDYPDYASLKEQVEKKKAVLEKIEGGKIYYGDFLETFQDINASSPYIAYMELKPGYMNMEGSGRDYDEIIDYLSWLLNQEEIVVIEKLATYRQKDSGRLNFRMSVRWESGRQ
ncbi:Tfp pilus assembly protein PilN [Thermosyntropha lipolytica DSM 11003]|uniref:Tfp pilus assembly protein PilN n=1 Tax=Thermosyntropha lipolytica DSM 11003 TaxID=1123382 RepID=A0A1M5LP33_9FIRM|nr:hypothetical protein [Thermosyntropha lipolytica]SHG66113.1 Tfp pilus assembly protein PilN [Thermosyntropha lipolytica DSM 11003]